MTKDELIRERNSLVEEVIQLKKIIAEAKEFLGEIDAE